MVEWTDEHVRCAVVELLQEMSQSKLACLSPLSQSTISNISNGKYCNKIGTRTCIQFGSWYHQYRLQPQAVLNTSQTSIKDSRMTFHPEHEVPVMKNWFMSNYSPSDEKLAFYAEQLNQGPIRSSRPKVTVMRLKNWWKNERQKEKKQQRESTESVTPTQRRGRRSQTTKNLINLDSGSEVNLIQHGQIAEAHSQLQPSSESYYSHSTYNYR